MVRAKKGCYAGLAVCCLLAAGLAVAKAPTELTDDEVKQHIIDESLADYSGSCACPYNSARNGSRCGGRSAWSKPGGASPVCYKNEVTAERIKEWREGHRE